MHYAANGKKVSGLKLLTTNSHKTIKGQKRGILTGILYLAPHNSAGIKDQDGAKISVCPNATTGCMRSCLFRSGASLLFRSVNLARARKTKRLFSDRSGFLRDLRSDIDRILRASTRWGFNPAIRLNGTSDLPWETIDPDLFSDYPMVRFYDYTKRPERFRRKLPENYSLVFSRSELNDRTCKRLLARGHNVAIVFHPTLPDRYWDYDVINGDHDDNRFLDSRGVIVGLLAKAYAKRDTSGFVVHTGKV